MAYRIKPHKSAAKQVRRTALERLGKAREALSLPPEHHALGIHEARKRLKEVRALLRLVREPLGDTFAQENRRLRDINRKLSAMRDASALVESWDALAQVEPALFAKRPIQSVRKRLVMRVEGGGKTVAEVHQVLNEVLADVAAAEEAVHVWPLPGKGFALVAGGLQRTSADGRKALAAAASSATDAHLHDWRKRVKDHWYHTRLLRRAWPAAFKVRTAMLKDLSELLGQDHDLSMLQELLDSEPALFGAARQRQQLIEIVGQRRSYLQREAFRQGRLLYAESPKALRKRWQRYWALARDQKSLSTR